MIYDFEQAKREVKPYLADYLYRRYGIENLQDFSSPFREDNDPSCNILPDGTAFYDHGTQETFDIFSVIQRDKECDFKTAFEYACSLYGVALADGYEAQMPVTVTIDRGMLPAVKKAHQTVISNEQYLRHYTSRGLTLQTVKRFLLGYSDTGLNSVVPDGHQIKAERADACKYIIPFLDGNGSVPFVLGEIYDRSLLDAGRNKYEKPYDMKQPLYNGHVLKDADSPVFITEGIYDALSIIEQGADAVALVGTSFTCLKDALKKYHLTKRAVLIIATDNDDAGREAGRRIYQYLTDNGYPCVTWHFDGAKDANELLMNNPASLKEQVSKAVARAYSVFHKVDKAGRPIEIIDEYIARDIIRNHDMFLRNGKLYLYSDGYYQIDEDGTRFKSIISEYIHPYILSERKITRVHALLLTKYDLRVEDDDVNLFPDHWIPFANGFLDLQSMSMYPLSADNRCIYQIPHNWSNQAVTEESVTARYLHSFFDDADDLEMFLQFAAICMTKDMHFQKMMILRGNGGIGKSVLLKMVTGLVGNRNISTVSMQTLNQKFQTIPLIDKVLNIYPDLESADMFKTDILKMLTGDDGRIPAEYKGGKSFSYKPICKLMFSANRVPKSRDEKTDAMYRRLLIVPFTHRGTHIDDLEDKLKEDIDSFIAMVVSAGHRLYTAGILTESANSQREVAQLHYDTDTVYAFLADRCIITNNVVDRVDRGVLYGRYQEYCQHENRQGMLNKNSFYQNLKEKGFNVDAKSGDKRYVQCLILTDANGNE